MRGDRPDETSRADARLLPPLVSGERAIVAGAVGPEQALQLTGILAPHDAVEVSLVGAVVSVALEERVERKPLIGHGLEVRHHARLGGSRSARGERELVSGPSRRVGDPGDPLVGRLSQRGQQDVPGDHLFEPAARLSEQAPGLGDACTFEPGEVALS